MLQDMFRNFQQHKGTLSTKKQPFQLPKPDYTITKPNSILTQLSQKGYPARDSNPQPLD